ELIYVNMEGHELSKNQKIILEQLNAIHLQPRYVAAPIERGDSQAIQQLSNALKTWISNQAITSELQEDGTVKQTMGKAALDSLNKLKSGSVDAINELKNEGNIAQHYTTDNFELVTWILIS
ncbi:MAG: helicase, partial [Bacteroidia bacterium]